MLKGLEGLRQRAAGSIYGMARKVGVLPDKDALRASRDKAGQVAALLDSDGYKAFLNEVGERRQVLMRELVYGDVQHVQTIRARVVELDWMLKWAGDVVAQGRKDAEALERYE